MSSAFIMVLIGCGQGQACAPVMTLPVAYQSKASCLADRGDMVAAISDQGYGRVIAECREQLRSKKLQTSVKAPAVA